MKSFIRVFCTLLMLAVASTAFSSPVFHLQPVSKKSFVLYLEEEQGEEIEISIQDEFGSVLLREQVKDASQFAKKYNLKALISGEYSLFIENETTVRIQPISISRDDLTIDIEEQTTIIKPVIRPMNQMVEVLVMPEGDTSVEMYIFDEEGHTLFSNQEMHSENLRRRFDLDKLEIGNYVFKVVVNGVTVRETISVKEKEIKKFSER